MPMPVGHSLAAVILNELKIFKPANSILTSVLLSIALANLADIDYLPGILMGNPNQFHHGFTHSIGAALLVGLVFSVCCYYREAQILRPFIFATSLYFSHVFLDYFSKDTGAPYGVPIFWPLSSEYFISPVLVFSDIHKDSSSSTFLQSLFVRHNALTILREILILVPLALVVLIGKRIRKTASQLNIGE